MDQGTVLIKCFLNISSAEQKERLIARLDDPTKHWKYNPGDVDERANGRRTWRYRAVLERCNTERARTSSHRSQVVSKCLARPSCSRSARPRPALASANFDVETEKAGSPPAECGGSRYALTTDRWRAASALARRRRPHEDRPDPWRRSRNGSERPQRFRARRP